MHLVVQPNCLRYETPPKNCRESPILNDPLSVLCMWAHQELETRLAGPRLDHES